MTEGTDARSTGVPAARPVSVLIGINVLLGVAYVASLFLVERPDSGYIQLWDGWIYSAATILPVLLLVLSARRPGGHRIAWLLIAGGLAATAIADLLYTYHDQNLGSFPVPGLSDVAYLSAYPFWWGGIIVLAMRQRPHPMRSSLLDGTITGLTVGAVTVALWLPPLLERASADREVALALAFAVCDVILVVLAITALMPPGGRPAPAAVAVVIASTSFALGDILYLNIVTTGEYEPGSQIEALYVFAVIAYGIAAWLRPTSRARARRAGPGLSRVAASAALVSVGLLTAATLWSLPMLAVWMGTAALGLALLRVLWTVHELQRINEGYEQARTDDLTGLGNRRGFLERVEALVEGGSTIAVLMVDLDGFKEVNDSLGHPAGDRLLVEVADRFRSATPEGWELARLGGDEFGLVAIAVESDAVHTARAVRGSLEDPIELEGIPVRVSASIGVSVARPTQRSRRDLLRTADVAMYEAKRTGKGVVPYRPELDPRGRERLALVDDLCRALDGGLLGDGFRLVYQPILRADDLAVASVEALLRWEHPRRGAIAPDDFLPIARRAGLVPQITRMVVRAAVADLAPMWAAGATVGLNINIGADDLVDESFAGHVLDVLREHGASPERITLELTEDELASDQQRARRTLERLRRVGVRVAIDDFGIGYSSLAQLLAMPIDQLKIDRSLVQAVETDPRAEAIVRSAVELGRTLALDVVAEGVESAVALESVRAAGVHHLQGFHLELPNALDRLAGTIARRSPHAPRYQADRRRVPAPHR